MSDPQQLPSNLPVPQDDGAADHLPGAAMPSLVLRDTSGGEAALDGLGPGRAVLVTGGRVEHALHPVFPPDGHAAEVVGWLRGRAAAGASA